MPRKVCTLERSTQKDLVSGETISVVAIARCSETSLVRLWILRVFGSEFWFGRQLLNLWLYIPKQIAVIEQPVNECCTLLLWEGLVDAEKKFVHLKNQQDLINGESVLVVVMASCRSPLQLWIEGLMSEFWVVGFCFGRLLFNLWFTFQH